MSEFIKTIKTDRVRWIDILRQSEEEINFLKTEFDFHDIDINECSPIQQRPKLVERKNYIFMILLFPFYDNDKREVYMSEIDFFIMPGTIVTIHDGTLSSLQNIFVQYRDDVKGSLVNTNTATLLYEILDTLLDDLLPLISNLSHDISKTEGKIFTTHGVKTVEEILQLKRSIVNIKKALQPHKQIIRKLIDSGNKYFGTQRLSIFYTNLVDHTKEIWDALENHQETINTLYETNMALYSLRLNAVMRAYTIVSVMIFAMSLTAAIFAIRAPGTPFLNLPLAFWIILLIEISVALLMYIFFRLRKWM